MCPHRPPRRTTRRTELTEEGQAFLQRTRAILASIDDAEEHMAARRQQPAGRLRVNAATPFMLHAVVPLVPAVPLRAMKLMPANSGSEVFGP